MLGTQISRRHFEIDLFSLKIGIDIPCKIIFLGDNLHEISKPIFYRKIRKKKQKTSMKKTSAEFTQKSGEI